MHRRALAAVALATISLASAPAGAASVTPVRLFERTLAPTGSLDANYLAGGADVNGDGHPDILLGSENATVGRVSLFSGTNGLVGSIDGRATATFLGSAVAFVGDLDGDGVSEFVASSAGERSASVYSGATRERLLPRSRLVYGGGIAALGDIDADGVPDFLVGRVLDANASFVAAAYSGKTGEALYSVTDASTAPTTAASAVGDIDGDGITEVLLGGGGATWLISGKTGAVLKSWSFGGWIHGVGDVSGDGVPDYALGNQLYSGATGEAFFQTTGPAIGLGQLDGAGGQDIAMLGVNGIQLVDVQANALLGTLEDGSLRTLAAIVMEPVGDLDGDGTIDFAVAGSRPPKAELHVYRNLRGSPHPATIDVLPKACPNLLAGNGGGPFEVAILGDASGDVSRIDVASVRLAGIAPASSSLRLRDVGTSGPVSDCACPSSSSDGITDLVLRFDAGALRDALAPLAAGTSVSLPVSGLADDGAAWFGSDCVTFAPRGGRVTVAGAPALRAVTSNVVAAGEGVTFSVPAQEGVRVTVFDLAGRRVAELPAADGGGTVRWDGKDSAGLQARRGVYFAQARAEGQVGRGVMVVVR